jgi:hypothetical protein
MKTSQRLAMTVAIAGVIAVGAAPATAAPKVTYSYVYYGNPFNDVTGPYSTSDRIAYQLTFSAPIPPNLSSPTSVSPQSFIITDGVQTITKNNNPYFLVFTIQTDSTGHIYNSDMYVGGDTTWKPSIQ